MLKETISNLSEYQQIFIDNLNGDGKINEIINTENEEIFKYFLDYNDKEKSINNLKDNKYFIRNIDNSMNKIIDFIKKNKDIKELISNYIENKLKSIINGLFIKNENLKEEDDINFASDKDIDMISIIKNYCSNLYNKKLCFLLTKIENSLLSFLISIDEGDFINSNNDAKNNNQENKNEIIKNLLPIYLNDEENINIIEKISKYIKERINKQYRDNEFNLRILVQNIEQDENQIYINNKQKYCTLTSLEFKKDPLISQIDKIIKNKFILNKICDYLIIDYYLYFIRNNLFDDIKIIDKNIENSVKNMFLLIIRLNNEKFKEIEKEEDYLRLFINNLNWLECYKNEIILILKMYLLIESKIKIGNIFDKIELIINSNNNIISYEKSDRVPLYSSKVNDIFFKLVDSMLYLLTTNKEIFNNNNCLEILNIIKEIIQYGVKINTSLNLFSKDLYSLEEIIEIISAFYYNNIKNKKIVDDLVNLISNKENLISNGDISKLNNYLDDLHKFILSKIGNDKNISKIMNKIFLNEYLKIPFKETRLKLLKLIITNEEYIYESSNLIKLILGDFISTEPNEFENNLEKLQNENNELIKILNNCENPFLEEILLNYFEFQINLYFKKIPEISDEDILKSHFKTYYDKRKDGKFIPSLLEDQPLIEFGGTISMLNAISQKGTIINSNLCKLYSISYIKIYLNMVIFFANGDNQNLLKMDERMNIINQISNQKLYDVLKLYIFKQTYDILNNDFEKFSEFNFEFKGFNFNNNGRPWDRSNKDINCTYFLPSLETDKNFNKYNEEYQNFLKYKQSQFKDMPAISFNNFIKKYELDTLIIIIMNLILSNFGEKDYQTNKKEYLYFYSVIKSNIINKKINNSNLNDILVQYYDYNNNEIKDDNKLKNINQKQYKILLYGFRFCAQSIINKRLISSLMSKDCLSTVTKNFIPGIDYSQDFGNDLHISTFLDIQNHFNLYPSNKGCYVCSCGYYYSKNIGDIPQGNEELSSCPNCKEIIGFEKLNNNKKYYLIKREGHYRIFKDEKQKKIEMSKLNITDDMVPNRTLNEYIKEVIEPFEEKENPGIKIIDEKIFKLKKKKVRNLSKITYRLLNFIIYSHLFFANYFEYLDDEDLENFCLVNNIISKFCVLFICPHLGGLKVSPFDKLKVLRRWSW